jgi:hypothetical protein
MRTRTHLLVGVPLLLCACTEDGRERPEQLTLASECGGFDHQVWAEGVDDLAAYCAAERLVVSHDATTAQMTLALRRADFNCCSDLDSEVVIADDGAYVIDLREDYPPDQDALCGCCCNKDVDAVVEGVAAGRVLLRIEKRLLDHEPWVPLPTTAVDLGPEPVEIVVDDMPSYDAPCEGPQDW